MSKIEKYVKGGDFRVSVWGTPSMEGSSDFS